VCGVSEWDLALGTDCDSVLCEFHDIVKRIGCVLPGQHPKWLEVVVWYILAMSVRSLVMQAKRILAFVLISAMGWYAPGFI